MKSKVARCIQVQNKRNKSPDKTKKKRKRKTVTAVGADNTAIHHEYDSDAPMSMSMNSGTSYPPFGQSIGPDPGSPLLSNSVLNSKVKKREDAIRESELALE